MPSLTVLTQQFLHRQSTPRKISTSSLLLFRANRRYPKASLHLVLKRPEFGGDVNWSLVLNLNNPVDKRYYLGVGTSATGNFYGTPRNFMLTLRAKF